MTDQLLKPPAHVAGLKILNRRLFEKVITVKVCRVETASLNRLMSLLKGNLLKLMNFKPVQSVDDEFSEVYLDPCKTPPKEFDNVQDKDITLQYENYSMDNVFKAVLPPEIDGFSSFTRVGHLVHVNLRDHLLPFKEIIGQILFDKVSHCKTVVNKSSTIDNTYRNFQMEILAGEPNYHVEVKENKCFFELDFSKVYWNSRLCTEHERIVDLIPKESVVFDIFAGVGPFAIPLAKKGCKVFANDLNPESYKWMLKNSKRNKIKNEDFRAFNKDAKDFILTDLKQNLLQHINDKKVFIIMNLPALAFDFLPNFIGLFNKNELGDVTEPPIILAYCFAKGENPQTIAKSLLCEKMGPEINENIIEIFRVRTVSNYKEMMRINFKLQSEYLIKSYKRPSESSLDELFKKRIISS